MFEGLDLMHKLTSDPGVTYRVRVNLESYQGAVSYAEYDEFVVDSEADKYRLHVGAFSGTAGTSSITLFYCIVLYTSCTVW